MGRTINVKDYGARGDVKTVFSRASMDAGSDVVRLPGGGFNQFDKKKKLSISRVGAINVKALRTAIKDYKNSEEVILESKSINAGSNLTVTWGTDDTGSVQKTVDIAEIGDTITYPPGIYCIDKVRLKSGISFTSQDGSLKSTITQIIRDNSTLFVDPKPKPEESSKPLKSITFQGLIFDGNIDHDENPLIQPELVELSNVSGHSDIKFLNCEIKNFKFGLYVHGTSEQD